MPLARLGVARGPLLCAFAVIAASTADAQQAGSSDGAVPVAPAPKNASLPVFDVPSTGVQFHTGDTWTQGEQTFRLYAVQSCIRGTTFTNAAGIKRDCGEASIAYFAALIKDAKPRCTALAQSGSVTFAVCAAHIGAQTLDLGTILITQGFAFAATDPRGKPLNLQYAVAEGDAQKNRRGLWASPDLPHPSAILRNAYQKAN
ncbi:MAG: thermonuclease family protein [Hyphomicrobiales bacterium]|nr:MAG: thermonuclease family protein [Hyphomicrobiales bacterium]